jgi:hypothetical protein
VCPRPQQTSAALAFLSTILYKPGFPQSRTQSVTNSG